MRKTRKTAAVVALYTFLMLGSMSVVRADQPVTREQISSEQTETKTDSSAQTTESEATTETTTQTTQAKPTTEATTHTHITAAATHTKKHSNFSTGFNITEDTSKPINRKNMRYPYKFSLNSLNINGNVKLTNKWAVSFNSGYDFNAKEITQTAFNITRDLHCFSMTAAISPFGRWKYYNFTIRANASILQDLKWEQRSQTQSNIQWY